jgi:uncharacterized protein (TIGR03435 family)
VCLLAQTAPTFEAADIHPSAPGVTAGSGGFYPDGRVEFRGTTLLRLIMRAWGTPRNRITHAPSWFDTDRFDIIAQASGTPAPAVLRNMLRALLAERFHLEVRNTEEPIPVYALVRNGQPKKDPKTETSGAEPNCKSSNDDSLFVLTCRNMTIGRLADRLPGDAFDYFSDKPVIDKTGMEGGYDFRLEWMARTDVLPGAETGGLTLYASLEKQLGITVENTTAPMPVFAIEHVDRTPTPNAPGTASKVTPQPTEFEVVDIRPSSPGQRRTGRFQNGRFDYKAISLRDLTYLAWEIEPARILAGEKWLDTDLYDVLGKTAPTSFDSVRPMLRAMLADRFHLKAHIEQQPAAVYAIEAAKPKLKEADPSELSTCENSFADGARVFTCRNTTMQQLAEKLRSEAAPSFLSHPVIDQTGLTGAYDFSFAWSPQAERAGRRPNQAPAAAAANPNTTGVPRAADPAPGLTIIQALDHQLGLKLKETKHTMDVLVIDHIDRTPTPN